MSTIEIISGILLLLACLCIIVLCLAQDQKQQQNMTSALGGSSNDSFYGKNSGRTKDAILQKITKVCAIVFFVATLVANIVPIFIK